MLENLKLKKVIKSFVPEPKESRKCFVYFGIPYVYFTCSYLGRIFLDVSMLQEVIKYKNNDIKIIVSRAYFFFCTKINIFF